MQNTTIHKSIIFLLFAVSILVYLPSLKNGFVLDDALVITENKFTQSADIYQLVSKDTFAGFFNNQKSLNLLEGGRYRPLSLVIFASIWQITDNPFYFHLLNVIFYALSVILLYVLIYQLSSYGAGYAKSIPLALLTAFIFSLHPVHTEVVNNIKSLDEILSLMLALVAWIVLIKSSTLSNPNLKLQLFIFSLYFLSLTAKETAVVFLPIIGISCYVFLKHSITHSVIKIAPLIGAFLLYIIIRTLVLGDADSSTVFSEPLNNPFLKFQDGHWVAYSITEKTSTLFYVLGKYAVLLIYPVQLTHDYYPQFIPLMNLNQWPVMLSILCHIVLVLIGCYGVYKRRIWGFALAVYLLSLFLFSNIPFTIGTLMAERFAYVPSIGFSLLLAWGLSTCLPQDQSSSTIMTHPKTHVITLCMLILSTWSIVKITDRSKDWKDNFTLFQADIKVSFMSAKLQNALGGELTVQSQMPKYKGSNKEESMLNQALAHLDEAIKLHPTYALAYMLKGNALHYLGKHQMAIELYQQAIKLNPNFSEAENNLNKIRHFLNLQQNNQQTVELEQQAFQAIADDKPLQAISAFTQMIKLNSNSKYHFMRGVAYAKLNQFQPALADFTVAENLDDHSDHSNTLRILQAIQSTYINLGNTTQASLYQQKIQALNDHSQAKTL